MRRRPQNARFRRALKALPRVLLPCGYGVVAVALITLLFWRGSTYDYAYDAELGGGALLSELFTTPPLQKPEIAVRESPSPPPEESGHSEIPGIGQPGNADGSNPGSGSDGSELLLPPAWDKAFYSWPNELENLIYAAEFDLASASVRVYVADLDSAAVRVSLDCAIESVYQNTLTLKAEYHGESFTFPLTVNDRSITINSVYLCAILAYDNPFYPGVLTLNQ